MNPVWTVQESDWCMPRRVAIRSPSAAPGDPMIDRNPADMTCRKRRNDLASEGFILLSCFRARSIHTSVNPSSSTHSSGRFSSVTASIDSGGSGSTGRSEIRLPLSLSSIHWPNQAYTASLLAAL